MNFRKTGWEGVRCMELVQFDLPYHQSQNLGFWHSTSRLGGIRWSLDGKWYITQLMKFDSVWIVASTGKHTGHTPDDKSQWRSFSFPVHILNNETLHWQKRWGVMTSSSSTAYQFGQSHKTDPLIKKSAPEMSPTSNASLPSNGVWR
jgi:hypothetical protein